MLINDIELKIENSFDKLFTLVNNEYQLKHGDISFEDTLELDYISKRLEKILNRYIENNK